ncbi:MAG: hypothetical protein NUV56_04445 [Candidatus Uhrbacteria bacterium]|nr:hypothetical protein [Candidatus Uhrbacteria bacterium]
MTSALAFLDATLSTPADATAGRYSRLGRTEAVNLMLAEEYVIRTRWQKAEDRLRQISVANLDDFGRSAAVSIWALLLANNPNAGTDDLSLFVERIALNEATNGCLEDILGICAAQTSVHNLEKVVASSIQRAVSAERVEKARRRWLNFVQKQGERLLQLARALHHEDGEEEADHLLTVLAEEFSTLSNFAEELELHRTWENYRFGKKELLTLRAAWEFGTGTLHQEVDGILARAGTLIVADNRVEYFLFSAYVHLLRRDTRLSTHYAARLMEFAPENPEAKLASLHIRTYALGAASSSNKEGRRIARKQLRAALRAVLADEVIDPIARELAIMGGTTALEVSLGNAGGKTKIAAIPPRSPQLKPKQKKQPSVPEVRPLKKEAVPGTTNKLKRLLQSGDYETAYDLATDYYLQRRYRGLDGLVVNLLIELSLRLGEFDFAEMVLRSHGNQAHPMLAVKARNLIHRRRELAELGPRIRTSSVLAEIGTRIPADRLAAYGTVGSAIPRKRP